MSKYEPLSQMLGKLKADYWRPTFLELERILEFKLPASARKNDIWWKAEPGGRHTHAHAWSAAGWKVQDVNVDKEKVTFVRHGAEPEDGPDYGYTGEGPFPVVPLCKTSIGQWDTEHCDQPVEGPFWATLNDRRGA